MLSGAKTDSAVRGQVGPRKHVLGVVHTGYDAIRPKSESNGSTRSTG